MGQASAEELQPVQVLSVRATVAQDLDAAELSTLCHPLQRLRALLDAHTLEPAQAALCRADYLTSLRVRPDLHVTTKLAALGYLAAEGTSPCASPSTAYVLAPLVEHSRRRSPPGFFGRAEFHANSQQ